MVRMSTSEVESPAAATGIGAMRGRCQGAWRMAVVLASLAPFAGVSHAATGSTGAPPPAAVDGVVMPAWLERDGSRQPVFPGMVLQERDRIVTGGKARILLTLPEGSKVKLGENAQLGFESLAAKQEGESVFLRSVLSVVTGAFRFTTNALSKATNHRDVNIHLATVTAGIRGTDLWGKQAGAREIVCLLEGTIEVARDAIGGKVSDPVILDQALQFYIAPKDEPALPIGRVPDAQLAQWAAETDIAPGVGGASVNGQWRITFDQQTTFDEAMNLYEGLRSQGYSVQFRPDKKAGKRIYLVQLTNLSSEADAQALASQLRSAGHAVPSVSRL